jgi:hypothetical protein
MLKLASLLAGENSMDAIPNIEKLEISREKSVVDDDANQSH